MKELIIPLAGIFALFVFPASIGLIAILKWHKSRNRLYQTIDDAIEKGAPPEVIAQLVALTESKEEKEEKKPTIKHLVDGAFFLAVGIAMLLFFYNGGPTGTIIPGVFCTLFGLGKLGIAAYSSKKEKAEFE